jgi:hypothetical protein
MNATCIPVRSDTSQLGLNLEKAVQIDSRLRELHGLNRILKTAVQKSTPLGESRIIGVTLCYPSLSGSSAV